MIAGERPENRKMGALLSTVWWRPHFFTASFVSMVGQTVLLIPQAFRSKPGWAACLACSGWGGMH